MVQGETRYGVVGRGLATAAAFVGGTVGGPVIGSGGIGYLAASKAKEVPESGTGKAAAAAAAGIGGAVGGFFLGIVAVPLMGFSTGLLANQKLRGHLDDISPQTSDDEESSSPSLMRTIAEQAKTLSDKLVEDNKN